MGTWKGEREGTASKVLRNTFSSMVCTLPVSALRGQCCGCVIDVRGVLVVWDGAVTIEGVGILDRRVEITSVFLSLPTQHLLSDRYANFLWYFNSPAALPDYWVVRSPTVRLLLDGPLLNLTLTQFHSQLVNHSPNTAAAPQLREYTGCATRRLMMADDFIPVISCFVADMRILVG